MNSKNLNSVFQEFNILSSAIDFVEIASGHINDTYLVKTKQKPYYILQKINHQIFPDVPGLVRNKVGISTHLKQKLKHLPEGELQRKVLHFVSTEEGKYYHQDNSGNYWNMMVFIDKSRTYERVLHRKVAYEGGKLTGNFLNLCSDFDASHLTEVIPRFHDMSFRFSQFNDALSKTSVSRSKIAENEINTVFRMKDEMHILQELKEKGKIRIRVTHNDTKISNILFNEQDEGLCMIDTDTIMPGIVHYDFGDAIRTICNQAAEDETELSLVTFNKDFYSAYKRGFMESAGPSLSDLEIKYLPLAAKTMTFIMALRFLTDYLNGNIYYKTNYENHNLDRARNQFHLIKSMEDQLNI